MPIQSFSFELKSLTDAGQFTGLASTYGNVDQGGDVVMPGAFARTLQDAGKQRPLLYEHRSPVGLVTLQDSPKGLLAEGQLSLGIQQAKDALVLLRDGVLKGLSIGFQIIKEAFNGDIRQLLEVKLFEVSLVCFPMNEQATVTAVKSMQLSEIERTARELRRFFADFKKENYG
jgi:HK97 family phage prohead protease